MKAIFAIALQTIRSSARSKVFLLIFGIILVATALLPSSIIGDATLAGKFKIKINYSLGIITFLTGLAALWVGTVNISREIEGYQIHMVITKPVTGFSLWLGKFIGVAALCLGVLYLSSAYIYWTVSSEVEDIRTELVEKSSRLMVELRDNFSKEEREALFQAVGGDIMKVDGFLGIYGTDEERARIKDMISEAPEQSTVRSRLEPLVKRLDEFVELKQQVLTGSTYHMWTTPDYAEMAYRMMVVRQEIKEGDNVPGDVLKARARQLEASQGNLKKATSQGVEPKKFTFDNLPEIKNDTPVFFRLRVYAGDTMNQKPRNTAFTYMFVDDKEKIALTPQSGPIGIRSTRFYTFPINPQLLKGRDSVTLILGNADQFGKRVQTGKKQRFKDLVIQAMDGPHLLIGQTSFFSNYWRCILLIALFTAFLVIVGTAAGLCFSTPVAVLISASYIIIGVSVSTVLSSGGQFQVEKYEGQTEENLEASTLLQSYFKILENVLVSVETFSRMENLTSGKEISWKLILKVLLYDFLIKGLPLILLGLYALRRRELGLVTRKA